MKRIAVVMAMAAEASPILSVLGARALAASNPLPFRWFDATRNGCEVLVAVNGRDPRHGVDSIGTEPAVLNTHLVIDRWRPDLVVSAGTAGGWRRGGGEVGDVYVSDGRVVHHDRRISMERFDEYGIGSYPVVVAREMATALGLKTGVVTTGNSLDESDDDRRMIAASGAAVKDMEAAAVAYVCDLHRVPFMALKAVTDLVDHHETTASQFTTNLAMASRRLADTVVRVVDWCATRETSDLR